MIVIILKRPCVIRRRLLRGRLINRHLPGLRLFQMLIDQGHHFF